MTPQERQLLTSFLQQLAQTRADPKDAEADALIREAISRQPDASYLLAQRAMGLDLALKAAQAQTEKLQAELDQAKRGNETSFVGNAGAWGRSAPAAGAGQQPLAPLSQSYGKPLAPAAVNAQPPSSWGSGMLANLATTAAGVVAGSFLYQGIEQMMGHHNAGFGGNNLAANSSTTASETNNAPAGTDDAPADDDVADAPDDDSGDSLALDDGGFDSSDLG
jgi:hypothetical protein